EVDAFEIGGTAEEFAQRDVAVAVAVHLAEPERPTYAIVRWMHQQAIHGHLDQVAHNATVKTRLAPAQSQLIAPRQGGPFQPPTVAAELREQVSSATQFTQAQAAVAIPVQQIEQAAAHAGNQQRRPVD